MGLYQFEEPDERLEFTGERYTPDVGDQVEHEHLHRYLFALRYCAGRRVVDVACGEGYGAALLGKVAAEVVGVDVSVETIAHASKSYGSRDVVFHAADAASIPVEDGHVDVVVSFETIEHLADQPAFVAEVARILRPEGLLILSTPERSASLTGDEANPFHVHELDRSELTALLEPHFTRVVVGGQRSDAGSSIVFPTSAESPAAASFFDRAGPTSFHGSDQLPAPVYLIVLATNGVLPEIGPSTLFDPHYLPRLHGEVSRLESDAETRREGLATYGREQVLTAHVASLTMRVSLLADEFTRLTDELATFSEGAVAPASELDRPGDAASSRAVLFLSGCPGDSARYRCEHPAAGLMLTGGTADSALVGSIDLDSAGDRYAAFVLHRVQWDEAIERLVTRARAEGKPVVFDSDDLVFGHEVLPFIAALTDMDEGDRKTFAEIVLRCRRTLSEVGAASVSTAPLHEAAAEVVRHVVTIPNAVSDEMVRRATEARASRPARETPEVVIAYLSGTPTHDRDFLEAADAVLWALETYENVRFMVVGHLRLDERFDRVADRVERIPVQPWRDVPWILTRVGVNLAPLEAENPFTQAKSCLKYLEAGLLGVPTVASPRHDFARVIRHGENGLLADTPEEWREALGALIESPQRRAAIGASALEDVRRNHTGRARARSHHRALASLLGGGGDRRLVVNWILRAPLTAQGGRYRTIFELANALASRGHRVRVYVEVSAQGQAPSDQKIVSFAEREFGPLQAELVVGYDAIAPGDVAIATNWQTAFTVAAHRGSLFKAYLVQDYEPALYDEGDPVRAEAEAAYELPLRHIAYGAELAERLRERTGIEADSLEATASTSPGDTGAQLERLLSELAFLRLRGPS